MFAVEIAHGVTESGVTRGATESLDPAVFVRGDSLGGELSADPGGLFAEDDSGACFEGRQSSGTTANTAPDNCDFSSECLRIHEVPTVRIPRLLDQTFYALQIGDLLDLDEASGLCATPGCEAGVDTL